ncbi:MAG: hypothetical protein HXX10_08345 [Rhodoplanes sp.]|uniref:hypothetical protein n=1 Tax=Rhodoplanes sp. TaxID=1968906 RepID=UPI0017D3BD35|nr:hypothetical protein [Rhodoplanes sp.]NVO14032.1 hypothetical protein [Rhodoplanes sp.]
MSGRRSPGATGTRLEAILARLAMADGHEEEEEIGRSELSSALQRVSPAVLDGLLKLARRDNRVRRCLSAARYYSGLGKETCEKIDVVLRTPFPGARRPGR